MRKVAITLAVILGLIVIALLVAPAFLDVNRYRDRIQAELQQRLDRPVRLGRLPLRLLPLSFSAENPVIGEAPGFVSSRPFAQADALKVSAALMPLLHGDVQISSLELQRPRIELIRNQQGIWNFSTLGKPAAPE